MCRAVINFSARNCALLYTHAHRTTHTLYIICVRAHKSWGIFLRVYVAFARTRACTARVNISRSCVRVHRHRHTHTQPHKHSAEHSTRRPLSYYWAVKQRLRVSNVGGSAHASKIASFENSTRMIVRISNLIFSQNINVCTGTRMWREGCDRSGSIDRFPSSHDCSAGTGAGRCLSFLF